MQYGSTMTRHLVRTHNIRISYLDKDILLFEHDASGEFLHMKIHSQAASAHACSVSYTLCMPIGSVFAASSGPHNWEVLAQSRCKKIRALAIFPKSYQHCAKQQCTDRPHQDATRNRKLPPSTRPSYYILFTDGEQGPTQNSTIADDNLLPDAWIHFKPALVCSAKVLHMLLG